MIRGAVAAIALAALFFAAGADAATVAVPKGRGPKPAGLAAIESQLKASLKGAGHKIVGAKALAAGAKRAGKAPASTKSARAAGAQVVVLLTAKKEKKGFTVELEAVAVEGDEVLHSATEKYKSAKDAKKVAAKLAAGLLDALEDLPSPPGAAEPEEEDDEPPPPPAAAIIPKDEEDEPASAVASGERDAPVASTRAETELRPSGDEERPILRLMLMAGAQAASAYAVTVGGDPTALAYNLSPLLLLGAGLRLDIPSTDLGIEIEGAFAPVRYALDVTPPVTPADPGGRFLDLGGSLAYRLVLSGEPGDGFALEPLIGVQYSSLSVDEQSRAIVLNWTAVAPQLGARALLGLGGGLELEADLRFRLIVSYSETPRVTGQPGSGIGLKVGGTGRYWLSREFGAGLTVAYEFVQVGMSGEGDRDRFDGDPALVDASVLSSHLRVSFGLILAI